MYENNTHILHTSQHRYNVHTHSLAERKVFRAFPTVLNVSCTDEKELQGPVGRRRKELLQYISASNANGQRNAIRCTTNCYTVPSSSRHVVIALLVVNSLLPGHAGC